jgi:hypothetical protein
MLSNGLSRFVNGLKGCLWVKNTRVNWEITRVNRENKCVNPAGKDSFSSHEHNGRDALRVGMVPGT